MPSPSAAKLSALDMALNVLESRIPQLCCLDKLLATLKKPCKGNRLAGTNSVH